jgi:phosphate acetyltransferase
MDIEFEDAYAITKSKLIKRKNKGENRRGSRFVLKNIKKKERFDFVLVEELVWRREQSSS